MQYGMARASVTKSRKCGKLTQKNITYIKKYESENDKKSIKEKS